LWAFHTIQPSSSELGNLKCDDLDSQQLVFRNGDNKRRMDVDDMFTMIDKAGGLKYSFSHQT